MTSIHRVIRIILKDSALGFFQGMSCSLTTEVFANPILGYIADTNIANRPCGTELVSSSELQLRFSGCLHSWQELRNLPTTNHGANSLDSSDKRQQRTRCKVLPEAFLGVCSEVNLSFRIMRGKVESERIALQIVLVCFHQTTLNAVDFHSISRHQACNKQTKK